MPYDYQYPEVSQLDQPPTEEPQLSEGTPGTMTIQTAGMPAPVTNVVRQLPPQPVPWWILEQDKIRNQMRQDAEIKAQVNQMMAGIQPRSAAESLQAIEAATRLEGQLGFASDVKAGVPMPQALAKWGGKMNPQNVRALQASIPRPAFTPTETTVGGTRLIQTSPNRFQIPPALATPETGPIEGRPVMMSGRQVATAVPGRGGSMHVLRETPERGLTPTEEINVIRLQMSELDKDIENTRDKAETARLQSEKTALRQRLSEITSRPTSKKKATPTVGQEVGGYRFKGGDPSKKENWEKM